jgi:hypothetical protein
MYDTAPPPPWELMLQKYFPPPPNTAYSFISIQHWTILLSSIVLILVYELNTLNVINILVYINSASNNTCSVSVIWCCVIVLSYYRVNNDISPYYRVNNNEHILKCAISRYFQVSGYQRLHLGSCLVGCVWVWNRTCDSGASL